MGLENTEDHLTEAPVINLVPANIGKRFINYIVDIIVFSFLVAFVLAAASPVYPLMNKIMQQQPLSLADRFVIWFLYGLFMAVMEALLKGKTIGKYFTATRAVDENGLPVSSQSAFLRGLIRAIPIDQFTAITFDFSPRAHGTTGGQELL